MARNDHLFWDLDNSRSANIVDNNMRILFSGDKLHRFPDELKTH